MNRPSVELYFSFFASIEEIPIKCYQDGFAKTFVLNAFLRHIKTVWTFSNDTVLQNKSIKNRKWIFFYILL